MKKQLVLVCIIAALLGSNIAFYATARHKDFVLPSYAEIHKEDCDTCACNNKADIFLITDFGKGATPVQYTYMCEECYTQFIVCRSAPKEEINIGWKR